MSAGIVRLKAQDIPVGVKRLVPVEQIHLQVANLTPGRRFVFSHSCFQRLLKRGQCLGPAALVSADHTQLVIVGALA